MSPLPSRAALRVVANLDLVEADHKKSLALTSLRAILTSAGRGVCRPAEVEVLERAARSAATSVPRSATVSDHSAVYSAARSAAHSAAPARSAISSAALSVGYSARSAERSATGSAARSAAVSATLYDATQAIDQLVQYPVWAGAEVPAAIAENHSAFLTYLDSHDDWRFWRRWYLEMWEGRFTDWDLAIEVAKIPDEVWDAGLSAVAEAIREIEARFRTNVSVPLVRNAADTAFELADEA